MKPSDKKLLIDLLKQKAVRIHFLDKMWTRLGIMWKEGRANTPTFKRMNERMQRFENAVDDLDDKIFALVPKGTSWEELPLIIVTD